MLHVRLECKAEARSAHGTDRTDGTRLLHLKLGYEALTDRKEQLRILFKACGTVAPVPFAG